LIDDSHRRGAQTACSTCVRATLGGQLQETMTAGARQSAACMCIALAIADRPCAAASSHAWHPVNNLTDAVGKHRRRPAVDARAAVAVGR
jgi:hypothetical protein